MNYLGLRDVARERARSFAGPSARQKIKEDKANRPGSCRRMIAQAQSVMPPTLTSHSHPKPLWPCYIVGVDGSRVRRTHSGCRSSAVPPLHSFPSSRAWLNCVEHVQAYAVPVLHARRRCDRGARTRKVRSGVRARWPPTSSPTSTGCTTFCGPRERTQQVEHTLVPCQSTCRQRVERAECARAAPPSTFSS